MKTSIQLEARKAALVRDILIKVNDEEVLDKLVRYVQRTIKSQPQPYPLLASDSDNVASAKYSANEERSYPHSDVIDEMEKMIQSW